MATATNNKTAAAPEYKAEARFQRVSPQKARLVLDLIRGQRVEKALETVAFTRKRVAPMVEKVLRSAVDNANYLAQERGEDLDLDRLFVKTAIANEGPRMKRIRPAPMGRAFRYQRRMSHIIVAVSEKLTPEVLAERAERAAAPKKRGAKKSAGNKTAGKAAPAKKAAPKKSAAKKKAE